MRSPACSAAPSGRIRVGVAYRRQLGIDPRGAERLVLSEPRRGHVVAPLTLRAAVGADVDIGDAGSIDRFVDGNRAVNVAIAAIVARLLDDSERAIGVALRAGAPGRGLRVRSEHEAVLDAIAAGDGAAAERLMRSAIERFRDELVRTLRSSPAVDDLPLA